MTTTMVSTRSAVISRCGKYRYHLHRGLGCGPVVTFIMLNPSTADAEVDDPTIRRCAGFARRWGCGALHVVNLFALRTAKPTGLAKVLDPVGLENLGWIEHAVGLSDRVVCAWGASGAYMCQDQRVLGWIDGACQPRCLGVTKDGHPRHPLYVPYSAKLVGFGQRTATTRSSGV